MFYGFGFGNVDEALLITYYSPSYAPMYICISKYVWDIYICTIYA